MNSNRANLDGPNHNLTYIILTVILLILSGIGIFVLFQLQKPHSSVPVVVSEATPTLIPTDTPIIVTPSLVESTPSAKVTLKPTLTVKPTATPKLTASPTEIVVTPSLSLTAGPTPAYQTFTSSVDSFTAIYKSNRKFYQDTESSGNRYTFYSSSGNFAVHVGYSWSWTNPNRQFSQGLMVDGNSTSVYQIDSQTLVDFQVGGKDYTIQCIHNGSSVLKAECTQFINDFKIN